ncbi:hypothetical protein [Nocardia fluminea]|uniref:hypothetical protein n=1 Tax=Nocardia fluminea TaxID=134984 RepID=UPI0033E4F1A5
MLQTKIGTGSGLGVGWKVEGLIVEGSVNPADLPGCPRKTGEVVDLDTVHGRPYEYGVAVVGNWTFIADSEFRVIFDEEAVVRIAGASRALAWVTNSVSTIHGFAWYREGEVVRQIIYAEGEVVDEYGPAIPEEEDAPEPLDEDYVFEMMERLTGVIWGAVADARYSVWACTE